MNASMCYDFLTWTSFPSSLKLFNDEVDSKWGAPLKILSVAPGAHLTVKVKAKQTGVVPKPEMRSSIALLYGTPLRYVGEVLLPSGSFEWREFEGSMVVPANIRDVLVNPAVGCALPDHPTTVWFDDLKIFQDDVLIYSNDFSKWDPVIGAGIGAPIGGVAGYLLKEPLGPMVSEVVGAVVGGALGGGVGLLTGLGIIPVPQIPIPSLGAAPEGPVAPARLGKYLITG